MRRELVGELLANRQPPSIFRRLVADEEFMNQLGLAPRTSLTLGTAGSFDAVRLFQAVRGALEEAKPQTIVDMEGATMTLTIDDGGLLLRREPDGATHRVSHPVFFSLAPTVEQRRRAFEELRLLLGPTAPQFEDIASQLAQRSPTKRELAAIFEEVANGVVSRQGRIVTTIARRPRMGLADLVPDQLQFFERCFGPDPGNAPPDDYLATILPVFRRELLGRDLAGGLALCLPASLRDDLTLTALMRDRSDDALWQALEAASPLADPFSALGALDLAISRSGEDWRFRGLAEQAVERLTAQRFDGPGGADIYVLLPPLALAIEDDLAELEGAMSRPTFWRRLCAFAHAAWLSHHLPVSEAETQCFCEWLEGLHTLPGWIRELLDLRAEPMWLTSNLSASGLRAEIVGRLALLVERHRREGHEIPRLDIITAAIEREASGPYPLARLRPGPLEGHRRPAAPETNRLLPEDVAQDCLNHLSPDLKSPAWMAAASVTDLAALPEEVLAAVTRLIEPDKQGKHPGSLIERRPGLLSAALIAARHRHRNLAAAVAAHCLAEAPRASDTGSIDTLFTTLLIAAATSEDECEWAEWLEPKLFDLAGRVPADARKAIDWYVSAFSALKVLLQSRVNVVRRAEATLYMIY